MSPLQNILTKILKVMIILMIRMIFLMIQKATAMILPMIPGMILLTLLMKIITKSPHGIL